jgi:DNA-3-methyladenine glycosylase
MQDDCKLLRECSAQDYLVNYQTRALFRMANRNMPSKTSTPQPDPLTPAVLRQAPILPREFFNRDPVTVGRELLGKLLIRRQGRKLLAGRVVEDEAYLGAEDPAAHAYSGRTPRNSVLFGPPGHAYVYFIYGNHYCFNVSCMPEGEAGGVLLRALEPVSGREEMARARGLELTATPRPMQLRLISSGPGRMSQALGITRLHDNDKDLTAHGSDLWFADDDYRPERIIATPRVGITKAVEQPLRFVIAGNPFVSAMRVVRSLAD